MIKSIFCIFIIILIFSSCSKKKKVENIFKESDLREEMVVSYKEGMDALIKGDAVFASKKFNDAELLYPQSIWAAKASLMSIYSLYTVGFYADSIFYLEKHIKKYPQDKNLDYAYYLMGICYFDQIFDEKKDLNPLIKSQENFEHVIKNYPRTDFAIDASFKMELILDTLAAKEMYLGRYYMKTQKWIPAMNRFQTVVKKYDQTIYVEEALHRLVEVYYRIGLTDQAKKAAFTLGYNYGSGDWYKKSYKIFNKKYKPKKIDKKKQDSFIKKKFKSLFE